MTSTCPYATTHDEVKIWTLGNSHFGLSHKILMLAFNGNIRDSNYVILENDDAFSQVLLFLLTLE